MVALARLYSGGMVVVLVYVCVASILYKAIEEFTIRLG
jgi:hypothetical protein